MHSWIKKKFSGKLGIEGNFFNLIKDINEKPKTNIILNSERLNIFLLRLRIRQGCLISPVIQHCTEHYKQCNTARKK